LPIPNDATVAVDLEELQAGCEHVMASWLHHLPLEGDDTGELARPFGKLSMATVSTT